MSSRILTILLICFILTGTLCAQNRTANSKPLRDLVTLNTSPSVEKRLRAVAIFLKEKEWEPAFKMMRQIRTEQGDLLIQIREREYISVSEYCHRIIAGLPEAGLEFYRKQVDLQAKEWYKNGAQEHDITLLQKILNQAYASRSGGKALMLLGELAWERGEPAIARHYWKQLLPFPYQSVVGSPLPQLRFPDSHFNRADVMSRLVLCSLAEGNELRARLEQSAFQKMFPKAKGRIAGQTDLLSELLMKELLKQKQWQPEQISSTQTTFAGNRQRNGIAPKQIDVGRLQWKLPLPVSVIELIREQDEQKTERPLSSYPVTFQDIVLVNGDEEIYAYHTKTGLPWPDAKDSTPLFSLVGIAGRMQLNLVSLPAAGIPRQTMTIHKGRLYAKLGTPMTSRPQKDQQLSDLISEIVCLDLVKGEGKLIWNVSAKTLQKKPESEWMFEGAPIVEQDRLYVATRRGKPQTEAGIACFTAKRGKLIWHKRVCSTISPVGDQHSFISHNLLTFGNQTIFYSTNMGAIVAVNAIDGRIKWAVTYPSYHLKDPSSYNHDANQSLAPCLYHQGIVIAAPNDSEYIFAIDAPTGRILWKQTVRGGTNQLLGVGKLGTLIVSGRRLHGIDILSGKVRWSLGYEDPIGNSYGRGILAGDVIYWSLREEILVVKQHSKNRQGRIVQRIPLKKLHGQSGGNLAIVNNQLLIAQPRHLLLFSPFAGGATTQQERIPTIKNYQ